MPIGAVAATLLGSALTNATNYALARSHNRFQERMSNTAHQRQAEDLRRAGINPLLGAGGVGASSPVGVHATMEDTLSKGVHSGLAAKQAQAQLKLLEAQTAKEWSAEALNYAHNSMVTNEIQPKIEGMKLQNQILQIDRDTKEKLVSLTAQLMGARVSHELASAFAARQAGDHANAQTILLRLQEQEYKNMNEAQKSFWMREVAPYLGSAKSAAGMAANIATPFAMGKVLGGAARGARMSRSGKAVKNSVYDRTVRNQAQNKADMPSLYLPD